MTFGTADTRKNRLVFFIRLMSDVFLHNQDMAQGSEETLYTPINENFKL